MPIITKYLSEYQLDNNNILLMNSLSGAMDIVDPKTKDKIKHIMNTGNTDINDDSLLTELKDRGYLFNSEAEENDTLEKLLAIRKSSVEKNLIMFVICPTTYCNLRCTYCFESEEIKNDSRVISDEQISNIFKHILDIRDQRKPQYSFIELFGGEPLLPSTLEINEKIFEFAKNNNLKVSIITNGTHIGIYKNVFEKYKEIIYNMQITVDGPKEAHDKRRIRIDKSGTFDVIVEGIDILLEIGIPVRVRINVDATNVDYLQEFDSFMKSKGWTEKPNFGSDVAPITDHQGSNEIEGMMEEHHIVRKIKEIYPQDTYSRLSMFRVLDHINKAFGFMSENVSFSKFSYCEANRLQFYVFSADGYVYACPETVGMKEYAIGTYSNELNLEDTKVNKWNGRNVFRIPKCKDCKIAPLCGGGCAYAAIRTNGDIDEPVCNNAENVISEYIMSIKDVILEKFAV